MSTLSFSALSKCYGRKTVFENANHQFATGITLLVGPSGAGKSTLLRLIATTEKPSSGTLEWNGQKLPGARAALRRELGYAPQAVDLPEDLTAREFILHMAALKGLNTGEADAQFGAIAEKLGLHADINGRISTYSGGMRRRLIFAQALLGSPKLIALDEPTAELDSETAAAVCSLIRERAGDAIIVMTTHLADDLKGDAVCTLRVAGGSVTAQ